MSKKSNKNEEKKPRYRVFNIAQYEKHPDTGEELISEEIIIEAIKKHKSIKKYAYICHDKDVFSEKELKKKRKEKGTDDISPQKGRHWHIVLDCPNTVELDAIAKWFGVKSNFVDIPTGRGAFLDCVQYLTHEKVQEKAQYTDEEITANFDFRNEISQRETRILKYGKDLDPKSDMEYRVLYEGYSLKQCENEDKILYLKNLDRLKKLRLEYLSKLKPPITRINYYIYGSAGAGKGLMAKALARNLYSEYEYDEDIFFNVGSSGAAFEGYDGQPVIIWNDRRALELLIELKGRENVFNVFDTHPTNARQNIKYGSINLPNVVNIVNSVEPYEEFLDGLVGEYTDKSGHKYRNEDKAQSYRRFPFIIPVHDTDIEVLINKGFMKEGSYLDYYEYQTITGNMEKIRVACGENIELAKKIEAKMVKGIVEKYKEIMKKLSAQKYSEQEIMEMFSDVGEIKKFCGFEAMEPSECFPEGIETLEEYMAMFDNGGMVFIDEDNQKCYFDDDGRMYQEDENGTRTYIE